MITVNIKSENLDFGFEVDEASLKQVRQDFNPSQLSEVDGMKVLGAACISYIRMMGNDARLTAMAASDFEVGAMKAVKSITAEVPAWQQEKPLPTIREMTEEDTRV